MKTINTKSICILVISLLLMPLQPISANNAIQKSVANSSTISREIFKQEAENYLINELNLETGTYSIEFSDVVFTDNSAKAEIIITTETDLGTITDTVVTYALIENEKILQIFREPSQEYFQYIDMVSTELVNTEIKSFWENLRQEEATLTDKEEKKSNVQSVTSVQYNLPWNGGIKYYVYQDFNKHFDFQTPSSSASINIRAARGGIIYNGIDSNGSYYVRILHSDGTYAFYVHLKPNTFKFTNGNTVKTGECIAMSGTSGINPNTGQPFSPHTHFNVSNSNSNNDYGSPFGAGWVTVQFAEGAIPTAGNTPLSKNLTGSCNAGAVPEPTTSVSASDGTYTDKIRISWNSSTGATYYQIWRNTTNSTSGATKLYDDCCDPYHDTNTSINTTYYYWVKACNLSGCSGFGTSDSGYRTNNSVPDAVTGVTVSDGTYVDYVRVAYNNVSNATRYEIWRGTSSNLANASKIFDDNGSVHHDSTASFDVVYYYWVRACNNTGCAEFSNSDSGYRTQTPIDPCSSSGNDSIACATSFNSTSYSSNINVASATQSESDPYLAGCNMLRGLKSVWYKLTPTTTDSISINTFNSNYDTILGVFSGTPENLTEIICNDDSSTTQSRIKINAVANTDYYILVYEFDYGTPPSNTENLNLQVTNAPFVESIVLASASPTSASSVDFSVTFSESVQNVDVNDFSLTTTGVSGASITGVTPVSASVYTVSVNTGSGNGTIRLDVPNTATISDLSSNALSGLPFTSGEVYSINKSGGPIPTTATFGDVPTTHPYFADIEILYANGYTAGCSTSAPLLFCPETTMNRAQSAVFMVRGNFGISYSPPAAPWTTFGDDFAPGPWAQPWAQGMFDAGLTAGCSNSPRLFCPWEEMPRFQAAVFGMRLKEGIAYPPPAGTGSVFADIDGSEWYAGWVEQAYLNGLLPACGSSSGTPLFCPNDLVPRGLAAYMIVRAKNLSMP